jgi:hypothetical protein
VAGDKKQTFLTLTTMRKNLNFILAMVAVVLMCGSILSSPDSIDYIQHTNDIAMFHVIGLLVLAFLFMMGAIILSLFPLSDESGRTKQGRLS